MLLIKKISLEGRVGVDIRNLEYMLLRAVKESEIRVVSASKYTYNSEHLIDATGGRFLNQRQGEAKIIGNINPGNANVKLHYTGKLLSNSFQGRLKVAQKGNTIFPMLDERELSFAYLKINYADQDIKNNFINFAHSSGDFGIYFWDGQMKSNNNRSLIFITLSEEEHRALGLFIKKPMYISAMIQNTLAPKTISTRIMNLIGFIDKYSAPESAIAEPHLGGPHTSYPERIFK